MNISQLPSLKDLVVAVVASAIGFGLAMGVVQAASDPSAFSGIEALAGTPALAQTDPAGTVLRTASATPDASSSQLRSSKPLAKATSTVNKRLLDPECMVAAVTKRDNALIAALDKYHESIIGSLKARQQGLSSAWRISDRIARKKAIKAVWDGFRLSTRSATKSLTEAKKNVWLTFSKERKSCGTYAVSDDNMSRYIDTAL